ncbi:Transcription factor bHLH70 [Bienertia sinuspersici]
MEKLQGPINPYLISEDLEVGNWLEEFINSSTGNYKFEDPYNTDEGGAYYVDPPHYTLPSLEDKMPFLQMLQTVEASQQQPLMQLEPNFQFLLTLQHQKITTYLTNPEIINHNHNNNTNNISNSIHNDGDLHSEGVKSESDIRKLAEEVEPQKCNSSRSKRNNNNNNQLLKASSLSGSCLQREKRKRKRSTTRPVKNKEEVETQRMTHIAVERNRRRQMNEHLNALRSLMPPSYVQRGDQASIIGGAIDFVKELEQMLQSLQAQKKMRQCEENGDVSGSNCSTSNSSNLYSSNLFIDSSPFHQLRDQTHSQEEGHGKGNENLSEVIARKSSEEYSAEKKSALADIEVVVIQNHVNLKIQCQRRPGQLLKAIVAFEELRLTVLHLNITSLHTLVHYTFNLKIEDDCKLGSADEVARAVHQIFSFINLN